MKNVLIGGVPRAGKSTLAKLLLQHHGVSVLRGDRIMSTLSRVHPETGVRRGLIPITPEEVVAERTPYLFNLFFKLTLHDDIPYVLESAIFSPDVVLERAPHLVQDATLVFLGYPNTDISTKRNEIHTHARTTRECLSHEIKGQELDDCISKWIQESQDIQKRCREHGFLFVDTSQTFEPTLTSAMVKIVEGNPNQTLEPIVASRAEGSV